MGANFFWGKRTKRGGGGGRGGVPPPLMGKIRDPPLRNENDPTPQGQKRPPRHFSGQVLEMTQIFSKNFACGSNFYNYSSIFLYKYCKLQKILPAAAYFSNAFLFHSEDNIRNTSFPAAAFLNWPSP